MNDDGVMMMEVDKNFGVGALLARAVDGGVAWRDASVYFVWRGRWMQCGVMKEINENDNVCRRECLNVNNVVANIMKRK
jgi:hypothetical protein